MIPLRLTRLDGVVGSVLGAGRFSVRLPDGASIGARLSRRFGSLHERLDVGERVLVGLRPRTAGSGLIITGTRPVTRLEH